MTRDQLLDRFRRINTWQRHGQRAPHKPLLILYALGRLNRGEDRMVTYREVDDSLRELLAEFGPPRKSYHPEFPFWHLQNDGLWQLEDADRLTPRKGHSSPTKSTLIRCNTPGGFPEPIYEALCSDPELMGEIAELILDGHFPPSLHEDILDAVGLELVRQPRGKRDPQFRLRVLRAYEHQCAICGFAVRLGNSDLALDAGHIKWHQAGGPDTEDNGLALCALHHKLFDRGALTVSADRQVLISQDVHGGQGMDWLLSFHGRPIAEPQSTSYRPNPRYLKWHGIQVFRAPARQT